MREILIECMSAFLKSDNFPGKRQYVARVNGMDQLLQLMILQHEEEEQKLGSGNDLRKVRLKLVQLLYDLLLNDDGIVNDGHVVRKKFGEETPLVVMKLLSYLEESDLTVPRED